MKLLTILFLVIVGLCPCEKVHHPNRLKTIEKEKTFTGIVRKVNGEMDGDIHIRLYIKDKNLLTKNNLKYEDSCLVLEIACANESMFSICKGYKNNIPIPRVGDIIQVTGPYIYDKIHGINEIHPIKELTVLK